VASGGGEWTRPGREEVEQLRGSLEYEMWMLSEASNYVSDHEDKLGQPASNAHFESFLLHAKVLIDFFFPLKNDPEGRATADDFVLHWSHQVEASVRLEEIHDLAERVMSRPTYAHVEFPRPNQLTEVCEELASYRARFDELLQSPEPEPESEPDS
jgi:hypothetical protein